MRASLRSAFKAVLAAAPHAERNRDAFRDEPHRSAEQFAIRHVAMESLNESQLLLSIRSREARVLHLLRAVHSALHALPAPRLLSGVLLHRAASNRSGVELRCGRVLTERFAGVAGCVFPRFVRCGASVRRSSGDECVAVREQQQQ